MLIMLGTQHFIEFYIAEVLDIWMPTYYTFKQGVFWDALCCSGYFNFFQSNLYTWYWTNIIWGSCIKTINHELLCPGLFCVGVVWRSSGSGAFKILHTVDMFFQSVYNDVILIAPTFMLLRWFTLNTRHLLHVWRSCERDSSSVAPPEVSCDVMQCASMTFIPKKIQSVAVNSMASALNRLIVIHLWVMSIFSVT